MPLTLSQSSQSSANTKRIVFIVLFFLIGATEFAVVYCNTKTHTGLATLNVPLLDWMVAHRTPSLNSIMEIITNIVSPVALTVIVLGGALAWAWHKKEVWRPLLLIGAMGITFVVSTLIKNIVKSSRPPTTNMVPPFELDYSFPSGHTIGVAVFLLVLGYLLYSRTPTVNRLLTWISIVLLGTIIIAVSRLYLGYHWLTDISASVGLALMILAIVMAIDLAKPNKLPRFFTKVP